MAHLIDKDALVAEVDKIKEMYCYGQKTNASFVAEAVINSINNTINTLEVKEVDLKKELNEFIEQQKAWIKGDRVVEYNNGDSFNHIYDLEEIARHFFELGMQVSNKAQKGE